MAEVETKWKDGDGRCTFLDGKHIVAVDKQGFHAYRQYLSNAYIKAHDLENIYDQLEEKFIILSNFSPYSRDPSSNWYIERNFLKFLARIA